MGKSFTGHGKITHQQIIFPVTRSVLMSRNKLGRLDSAFTVSEPFVFRLSQFQFGETGTTTLTSAPLPENSLTKILNSQRPSLSSKLFFDDFTNCLLQIRRNLATQVCLYYSVLNLFSCLLHSKKTIDPKRSDPKLLNTVIGHRNLILFIYITGLSNCVSGHCSHPRSVYWVRCGRCDLWYHCRCVKILPQMAKQSDFCCL